MLDFFIVHRSLSKSCTEFLNEFSDYLSLLAPTTKNLLLVGDFNIHINDSSDRHAQEFLSLISSFGLVQHITEPTHRSGNTLNLALSQKGSMLMSLCSSFDCAFPDNFPEFLTIAFEKLLLP